MKRRKFEYIEKKMFAVTHFTKFTCVDKKKIIAETNKHFKSNIAMKHDIKYDVNTNIATTFLSTKISQETKLTPISQQGTKPTQQLLRNRFDLLIKFHQILLIKYEHLR